MLRSAQGLSAAESLDDDSVRQYNFPFGPRTADQISETFFKRRVCLELVFDCSQTLDSAINCLSKDDAILELPVGGLDDDRLFRQRRLGRTAKRLDQNFR